MLFFCSGVACALLSFCFSVCAQALQSPSSLITPAIFSNAGQGDTGFAEVFLCLDLVLVCLYFVVLCM